MRRQLPICFCLLANAFCVTYQPLRVYEYRGCHRRPRTRAWPIRGQKIACFIHSPFTPRGCTIMKSQAVILQLTAAVGAHECCGQTPVMR